jgi:hypothetical protein
MLISDQTRLGAIIRKPSLTEILVRLRKDAQCVEDPACTSTQSHVSNWSMFCLAAAEKTPLTKCRSRRINQHDMESTMSFIGLRVSGLLA